jgi:hypothetical protein
MSDDFGTISARRGDRLKEIEVLRRHRESLVKMLEDVDQQLRELEVFDTPAARPLVTTTEYDNPGTVAQPGAGPRVLLLIGAALLALLLIGWLIWRASSDRPEDTTTVVEETTTEATTTEAPETETTTTAQVTVAEVADALVATPGTQDYGLVRKGTRVTRQYEIANNTEEPISINLARSACRCLYYEHAPVVPPKAKESITVTVDGAKAAAGSLRETIRVTSRGDAAVGTSFDVIATVR